ARPLGTLLLYVGEERRQHDQGDEAKRYVHVEHPPPRQIVGEVAADQRADDAGQPERSAEQPLVACPFPRWEQRRDSSENGGHHHATAEVREPAEDDKWG